MDFPEKFGSCAQPAAAAPARGYAKLGPGADVTLAGPEGSSAQCGQSRSRVLGVMGAGLGLFAALIAGNIHHAPNAANFAGWFSTRPATVKSLTSADDIAQLNRMKAQQQAETLLELAVGQANGALEQIDARVDGWRGKLAWDQKIANLTTAALNSSDMQVRSAGIEVELAAYGLSKSPATVESVVQQANSSAHAQKIWALWTLGLLGNRGVETDRVVESLTAHLKDNDVDSRRWSVEGLALVGTDSTISPLLQAMHDDPAPSVRERAACSLASSGMFTGRQRMQAVPLLVSYSDDPALDAQTHTLAFQALADITHQRLPNDSSAWRNWYASQSVE